MLFDYSILSVAASGLYAFVVAGCVAAATTAQRYRQLPRHVGAWLLLAVLFAALIPLRLFEIEEAVRDGLRASMRFKGSYSERRDIQGPIVAALILLAGVGAMALLYRTSRNVRGRRNVARITAMVAAMAMLFLVSLRMISLHAVDVLLYGALKLNWVIDIGSSVVVICSAALYIQVVRRTA